MVPGGAPGPAAENDPSLDPSAPLDVPMLLRRARTSQGLSARGLSLQSGLSDSVVGKIESGASEPTLKAFAMIVTALRMSDREIAFLVHLAAHRDP